MGTNGPPSSYLSIGEIPSSEEGQESSGGAKRKLASEIKYDGVKEDLETIDQRKQQIRIRSAQLHNQNERRDRSSILDDAIEYIKSLQYHVQKASIGASHSTFNSPMMMMQQTGQQMIPRGNNTGGMEYEIGTGIPGVFTPFNPPTNPYYMSLSNIEESSCMDWTPFYDTTTSSRPDSITSQGPMSEQSFTWMESTERVLPSKVVQSHFTKEIMACGSSNSTSNEWPCRKPEEEHRFQMIKFKSEKDLHESRRLRGK